MRKAWMIRALALCPWMASAAWEAPPDPVTGMANTLLTAAKNNDLEKFQSVCDASMIEAITPQVLANVSEQVSSLMEAGYQTTYMGVLKRGPYLTYFWSMSFEVEGSDDVLVEISVKDGKVGGFLLR